jgi:hypothetical protein
VHLDIAHLLLADARWDEGWATYLHWRESSPLSSYNRTIGGWRWEGEDAETILVFEEQGIGDSIQWMRHLPALARRGAKVSFAVRPELKRLVASAFPAVAVLPLGDTEGTGFG